MTRLIRTVFIVVLLLLALPYGLVPLYRVGHPVSTLMLARWFTGQNVTREWLDLAEISPVLPLTVIAAEDARFCSHRGIDWDALQDAIEDAQDGDAARGGSTITQQVAKNLFLWSGRSFIRKGLEFPLALWIDLMLPKRRVLEIYLNIAEWGPNGPIGAEAGAQYAFGRSA
jgi:monofunctional biosynthetic peptidoglycan transglycosylase